MSTLHVTFPYIDLRAIVDELTGTNMALADVVRVASERVVKELKLPSKSELPTHIEMDIRTLCHAHITRVENALQVREPRGSNTGRLGRFTLGDKAGIGYSYQ